MLLRNKAYPYPVLRPDTEDYTDSEFQASVTPVTGEIGDTIHIDYRFDLSSEALIEAIDRGAASFALDVRCSSTIYCEVHFLAQSEGRLEINAQSLFGSIEVVPMIIVQEEILNFRPPDLNEEFGDASFTLKPGDYAGFGEPMIFSLDFGKFRFESLVKVLKSEDVDPYKYNISVNQDYILIYMGHEFHRIWTAARNDVIKKPYIVMSVYKDCVMSALECMLNSNEEEEFAWSRTLRRKAEEIKLSLFEGMPLTEINLAAQQLVSSMGVERIRFDA